MDGSQRGAHSVTHRGLSAQLQALLQVQLVALGGYDGPAGEKLNFIYNAYPATHLTFFPLLALENLAILLLF